VTAPRSGKEIGFVADPNQCTIKAVSVIGVRSQQVVVDGTSGVAEGATTQAVKARLLDDAGHYDELVANADLAGAEAEKP
jgi:hypothetical protein